MIGAIAGDIIGSIYEHYPTKSKEFPLFDASCQFTDDTVLTVAVADTLLDDGAGGDYAAGFRRYYRLYPDAGYGGAFHIWARSASRGPYNSFGNGSAMRVGPVAFAFDDLNEVRSEARRSAEVTHNHPEGVKGAEATASAVFLARTGQPRNKIRTYIEREFGYDLSRTPDEIRPNYSFDVTCQGTVPAAFACFLNAQDYEDAVRTAISLGGDSDTLACIAGGMAGAFWGVPDWIRAEADKRLDDHLKAVIARFAARFPSAA